MLCSSELMPNNLILSTATLSGHSTHAEWERTACQISFIGVNHSLLLKSVKHCQLTTAEDLCKDLKLCLRALYTLFAIELLSSRKSPCAGGNLYIELTSYMTIRLLSIIKKYSLADAREADDRASNFSH